MADLFRKRGPFWEEVRRIRDLWGIAALAEVPPSADGGIHYPSSKPEQDKKERRLFLQQWLEQLFAFRKQIVPETYSYIDHLHDWHSFLSACLIYDPPDTKLEEFADYADPALITAVPPPITADLEESPSDADRNSVSGMVAPPIKFLPDPYRLQEDTTRYWRQIIDEIGQQFLEPMGFDVWAMVEAVEYRPRRPGEEFRGPADEYAYRVTQNEPRPYIFVDETITEDRVNGAFKLIVSSQGGLSKGGRPSYDKLTAIQCAILFDRHGCSYKRLAERYGWTTKDAAKKTVERGREFLN